MTHGRVDDLASWGQEPRLGVGALDDDHDAIVGSIDALRALADRPGRRTDEVTAAFGRLIECARAHFVAEEQWMLETGFEAQVRRTHAAEHAEFIALLEGVRNRPGFVSRDALIVLCEYLRGWFACHVRGSDRLLVGVDAGGNETGLSRQLLARLGAMVEVIATRSLTLAGAEDSLRSANRLLDERVEARTRELEARNEELREAVERLEIAQNQLLQSDRLAAIGQLSAGVAHEINNPIAFVHSNLGTLRVRVKTMLQLLDGYRDLEGDLPDPARARARAAREHHDLDYLREDTLALLAESSEGLSRVTSIVRDLKSFAHVGSREWQEADLIDGLESTLNMIASDMRFKVTVVRSLEALPMVTCLPNQINQVFMNLLVNATDAIDERGTVTLRSGRVGDEVWVEVEDTGCGMPPEVLKHIFEPFYTTKPVGKGTGLGLPVSYGIVKKHDGRIDVHSVPGEGTRVRIWLPISRPD